MWGFCLNSVIFFCRRGILPSGILLCGSNYVMVHKLWHSKSASYLLLSYLNIFQFWLFSPQYILQCDSHLVSILSLSIVTSTISTSCQPQPAQSVSFTYLHVVLVLSTMFHTFITVETFTGKNIHLACSREMVFNPVRL